MSIWQHADEFDGKPVQDFRPGTVLEPETTNYRLRVEYDDDIEFSELLAEFLSADDVDRVTGLVIGAWGDEMHSESTAPLVEAVVAAAGQLASLTGLFLGDIISEENEISWINQTDVSPIWQAFPRLRVFQIRGSQGLSLGRIAHDQLQTLIIECGGLPATVLKEIAASRLPELRHLELYLGDGGYGWDGTIDDVAPLLTGDLFPKLKYLGLKDSEIQDDVAKAVCASPLLDRIEVLDLSLGTLTDEGGNALLGQTDRIRRLKKLDVHHHFLSHEVIQRVADLPIEVDVSEQEHPDEYRGEIYRYVAVAE